MIAQTNDEPSDPDLEEAIRLLEANSRGWNGYWAWKDKPVGEKSAAEKVLTAAGLEVVDLRSRLEDPPDCEAVIDGQRWGIEVTELLHRKTLERSLKGQHQYFIWDRRSLLSAIQERIDEKDTGKVKGGPYDRYALIIVTDEMYLYRQAVEVFLNGVAFQAKLITDVFLGLSYHPNLNPEGGSHPVFRLNVSSGHHP